MMKQRFLVVFILLIINVVWCVGCENGTPYMIHCSAKNPIEKLPEKARLFIEHYFTAYEFDELEKIKGGSRLFFLTIGYIEFDVRGAWRDVNGGAMQLPSSLVKELPEPAVRYIKKGYERTGLKRIVRNKDSYTIWFIFPKDAVLVFDVKGKVLSDSLLEDSSK